jgi:hypothetical protein
MRGETGQPRTGQPWQVNQDKTARIGQTKKANQNRTLDNKKCHITILLVTVIYFKFLLRWIFCGLILDTSPLVLEDRREGSRSRTGPGSWSGLAKKYGFWITSICATTVQYFSGKSCGTQRIKFLYYVCVGLFSRLKRDKKLYVLTSSYVWICYDLPFKFLTMN